MCRRNLYFKGMHKVVNEWDKERAVKKNEEAFNQAFEDIFEDEDEDEDEESDTDSDSWDTMSGGTMSDYNKELYSQYMLGEIVLLQKSYQKAEELGIDFEWYLQNSWFFEIEPSRTFIIFDDVFPHFKNIFVSNHKNSVRNKRVGARVSAKTDTGFTAVFVVVF